MLAGALWILLMGFFVDKIARRLGDPPLIGMILVGIILEPQVSDILSPEVLKEGDNLRIVAVMIILMKAGLGLDREKLAPQGTVALRLGILPAAIEANAIAFAAMLIFKFDFPTGLYHVRLHGYCKTRKLVIDMTHYQLPITNYPLPITHYQLPMM